MEAFLKKQLERNKRHLRRERQAEDRFTKAKWKRARNKGNEGLQ